MEPVLICPKIFATWSKTTESLACVLMLNKHEENINITIEPSLITVHVGKTCYRYRLNKIVLCPKTCHSLKYLKSGELHFSLQGRSAILSKLSAGKLISTSYQNDIVDKIERLQHHWYCVMCREKILSNDSTFSRILPLPSENWSDFADMWFCHDPGNSASAKKNRRLLPQPTECFVGETYVLIHSQCVRNTSIMLNGSGDVTCCRCTNQLGVVMDTDDGADHIVTATDDQGIIAAADTGGIQGTSLGGIAGSDQGGSTCADHNDTTGPDRSGAVVVDECANQDNKVYKLFLNSVLMQDISDDEVESCPNIELQEQSSYRCGVESFFSRLLLEQCQHYTSYRFIIESKSDHLKASECIPKSEDTSTCLLWLLDPQAILYTSDGDKNTTETCGNTEISRCTEGCLFDSNGFCTKCQHLEMEDEELSALEWSSVSVEKKVVMRVMFKCQLYCTNKASSTDFVTKSIISMWRKDNTVHGFTLPLTMHLQLINLLVANCKMLPKSQRYLNGFHMSFIRQDSGNTV